MKNIYLDLEVKSDQRTINMIDLGLSDEYLKGFNDRLKDIPFDNEKSDDWQMGWHNADQQKRNEK